MSWNKKSADAFLSEHGDAFKTAGFNPTVVGSVSTKGESSNDLDVHLHGNEYDSDFEHVVNHFQSKGYRVDPEAIFHNEKGQAEPMATMYHPEKKHTVDFFFGRLRKPALKKSESLEKKDDSQVYWHGTPSGDLRGGPNGLHLGTEQAAREALNARIGHRADGKDWDGTQEYGKTLLAGKKTLERRGLSASGYSMEAPDEDHYPLGHAKYGDRTPVPMHVKPEMAAYRLKGPMTNTPGSLHDDAKANGLMSGQIKRGTAKKGYYYKNIGEDSGSTSIVVPHESHVEKIGLKKSEPVKPPKANESYNPPSTFWVKHTKKMTANATFQHTDGSHVRILRAEHGTAPGQKHSYLVRRADYKVEKSESLEKAMSPEELATAGYSFKVLNPTKKGRGFAVSVHHGKKRVGHLVFEQHAHHVPEGHEAAHKNGYHSVYSAEIDESHRGKGLYQHMLTVAAKHAKTLGSKGVYSSGYQRSSSATRAWDKAATHASRDKTMATRTEARNADYFIDGSLKKADAADQPTSVEAEKKKSETKKMWKQIGKYFPDKPETPKPEEKVGKSEPSKAPKATEQFSNKPFADKLPSGKKLKARFAKIKAAKELKEKDPTKDWDKALMLKGQNDELEKGFKEAALGVAAAAGIASASIGPGADLPPPRIEAPKSISPKIELRHELQAIAQIESSGGKNKNHPTVNYGLNAGHKAGGSTGLMPITVQEAVKKNPVLKQKYGHLLELKHHEITDAINKNPEMEADIANHHWARLDRVFGSDHARKAYAWNQGITGAKNASHEQVHDHPYVKKFMDLKKSHRLEKMSRPKITLPNFPIDQPAPGSDVQILETNRQAKLFAHKVVASSETLKGYPESTKSRAASSVARKFSNRTKGVSYGSGLDGPKAAAIAGKLRTKFEENDEEYQSKLNAHHKAKEEINEKWIKDTRAWRDKAHELHTKYMGAPTPKEKEAARDAYNDHYYNSRPGKPKYPRKPVKPKKDTKALSSEQQVARGQATESTIQHESYHNVMSRVQHAFDDGKKARRLVTQHLMGEIDVKPRMWVGGFIRDLMGYREKDAHFDEEIMAHMRDILVDKTKRSKFREYMKSHHGKDEFFVRNIETMMKQGIQKAYERAKQLTPQDIGLKPKKGLNKSEEELSKMGAMQRIAPFNPQDMDENKEEQLAYWQGGSSRSDDETPRDLRNEIDPEQGAVRTRFLHKLTSKTKVRRAADGKREFLLHRGMGPEEAKATIGDTHTEHTEDNSSWTPRANIAGDFKKPNGGGLASAWIHEDKIHTVPMQYGKLPVPNSVLFSDPEHEKPKGENKFSAEHEVIVGPHRSENASFHDLSSLPSVHDKIMRRAGLDKSDIRSSLELLKTLTMGHSMSAPTQDVGGTALADNARLTPSKKSRKVKTRKGVTNERVQTAPTELSRSNAGHDTRGSKRGPAGEGNGSQHSRGLLKNGPADVSSFSSGGIRSGGLPGLPGRDHSDASPVQHRGTGRNGEPQGLLGKSVFEGDGGALSQDHYERLIIQSIFALLKSDDRSDPERMRLGDAHPNKPYVVVKNPHNGRQIFEYNDGVRRAKDNFVKRNVPDYVSKHPAGHQMVMGQFINKVSNDASRHFVAGGNISADKPSVRQRHVAALLSGEDHVHMQVSPCGNHLTIWAQRHGEYGGPRIDKWTYTKKIPGQPGGGEIEYAGTAEKLGKSEPIQGILDELDELAKIEESLKT